MSADRAIYIRTSTQDQSGSGQEAELRGAAAARGWGDHYRVYRDIGHSGARRHRPGLDGLEAEVLAGRVREVMVVTLDRFGRSLPDFLAMLERWTAAGCNVVCLRQHIDLQSSFGRFQQQILLALAEYDRELARERVAAGMRAAAAAGQRFGRPRKEIEPATMRRLRELRAAAWSYERIAQSTGLPKTTVRRMLVAGQKPAQNAAGHKAM